MDLHTWMTAELADVRHRLFDSVVNRIPTDRWHEHVDGGGSTITYIVLHLARHQDLAVRTAIRNQRPLFGERFAELAPGAGLSETEDAEVTAAVTSDALLDYVVAVFAETAAWLDHTGSLVLDTVPKTSRRLDTLAGIDTDHYGWLHRMWDDQPVHWFLRWPVLGHSHAHIGEAISVRNRMGLSPF